MKRLVLVLALVLVALPVAAWARCGGGCGDPGDNVPTVQGYGDQVATFSQGYVVECNKECGDLTRVTIDVSKLKTSFDCDAGGDGRCCHRGNECGVDLEQSSCNRTEITETLTGHFRYKTEAQWVAGSAAMNTLGGLSVCGVSRCGPDVTAELSQNHSLNLTATDVAIAGLASGTFSHLYNGAQTLNLGINKP